ncbi:hypothetical protein TBLA_0C00150 [Henningerozyma blattae CBS 6284]|uniref:Ran-specific GTPase-activating protein 30 n=1 Tax=Henningerozyma blattae (strain ATCC 34711 / CBS 6284 / DSM 70876 / NBRC 10599 / NRRL Y-10934 / UCD 77-7) TaxID=1071380 RepID=I2H0D5_HENB6|nr:hypothetical protein TBLA_0C00150 [Tetrapisispora blattae CBS 6284]CCH59837.1 hypothetical protein TBLA_0C00150 [Tetrapisispora blattae CBS 6284]
MDELLVKAGSQAVSFAIKSGVSVATTYAISTITKIIKKDKDRINQSELTRIEILKSQLEARINIVSSAIDLIKLVAVRGNTNLDNTIKLTSSLKIELDTFDEKLSDLYNKKNGEEEDIITKIEQYIQDLLKRIEEITPFINLSLTTSGANLSTILPQNVSTNLLLNATSLINEANNKMKSNLHKLPIRVGPIFQLTLYSIFYNASNKSNNSNNSNIIWKEEIKRCNVSITQDPNEYIYKLNIIQNLNDDRYHEETDDEENKKQKIFIEIKDILKLFFSVSGRLLKLDDDNEDSPVLIVKFSKLNDKDTPKEDKTVEWYGLSVYDEFPDEIDNETDNEDKSLDSTKNRDTSQVKNRISLLEYLIRLVALQENDNNEILNIKDERLSLYLNDENINNSIKKVNNKQVIETTEQFKKLQL